LKLQLNVKTPLTILLWHLVWNKMQYLLYSLQLCVVKCLHEEILHSTAVIALHRQPR